MSAVAQRAERADAQRNRQNVLETADRLFAERGAAVSLNEIATAAGVGAGTVYRHFPTKDALLATVLDQRLSQLGEYGERALAMADPGEAFRRYLRFIADQALANRAICEALAAREDWVEPAKASGQCVVDTPLSALLVRAQRAGVVRADLDTRDVRALLTACAAIAEDPARVQRLLGVMWDGIRAERNSEIRNETVRLPELRDETKRNCPVCGDPIPETATGRPAKYCSAACRQKAFREKRKTA
ncbi:MULTISPECIES: SbtR family transcriptional regulator [Glycomyces]|uniref:AcrR family transcriptional regulator n=2 Tax=Glycomyces TaxID=58113 RepID=A0A9X3PLN6_9ACTN|nr:TetR family transcriptional regulator [Glycomyces lechevalierae]MDA1387087.1 TetR family transcriptional regulator [Glycomyces lechevalierae]MDR7336884.1 AcrR family transcriptional regulator [Glycomyces lechevalierae]